MFDAHIHSVFSDGSLDVPQILKIAEEKNIVIGIADHAGSDYPLNSQEKLLAYLSALEQYPVRRSLELNINEEFPLSDAVMKKLDYRIGGVHYEGKKMLKVEGVTADNPRKLVDTAVEIMLAAMNRRRIDILSHPTCLPNCIKHLSKELFTPAYCDKIISVALKNNIHLEINSLFQVPDMDFVERALRAGARFSLGSDGHKPESVCNLGYSEKIVRTLNISEKCLFGTEFTIY